MREKNVELRMEDVEWFKTASGSLPTTCRDNIAICCGCRLFLMLSNLAKPNRFKSFYQLELKLTH